MEILHPKIYQVLIFDFFNSILFVPIIMDAFMRRSISIRVFFSIGHELLIAVIQWDVYIFLMPLWKKRSQHNWILISFVPHILFATNCTTKQHRIILSFLFDYFGGAFACNLLLKQFVSRYQPIRIVKSALWINKRESKNRVSIWKFINAKTVFAQRQRITKWTKKKAKILHAQRVLLPILQ